MASAKELRQDGAGKAVVEIATTVGPELKVAAAQALLSEGDVKVAEVLRHRRGETLALVQRLLASAGIKGTFSLPELEDESAIDIEIVDAIEERQPSQEDTQRILRTLRERLSFNFRLRRDLKWSWVKSALEKSPETLWSIDKMEAQGHMPGIYNFDKEGLDIGTCSQEAPLGALNCAYDAEAGAWLKETYPNIFNESAVEMADAMGVSLMSPAQYTEVLQRIGKFDRMSRSWLLTDEATRKSGKALIGYLDRNDVRVYESDASTPYDRGGWRGSLRVSWA